MVSSITKLMLIGVGLAIAAGVSYLMYQNYTSDTLSGQLARSRLGQDNLPPISSLINKEGDFGKPLREQPKDWLQNFLEELYFNATGKPLNLTSSNAAFYK